MMYSWNGVVSRRALLGAVPVGGLAAVEGSAPSGGFGQSEDLRPAIAAKGPFLSVKDTPYNARGDGVADDTEAFNRAIAAVAEGGSGGTIWVPPGTYRVREIDDLPDSVSIMGSGMFENGAHTCVIKYIGSKICLRVTSRNMISNIRIEGAAKNVPDYNGASGTGVYITGGYHRLDSVFVRGFSNGIIIDEAYWCNYYGCIWSYNEINVVFSSKKSYSTTQLFLGCTISYAKKQGIKGVSVPIRNVVIQFIGGSIESNVQDGSNLPQVDFGMVGNLLFNGTYFEDIKKNVGNTLNLTGAGQVSFFNCYFNGAIRHIYSNIGTSGHITIEACRFLGTQDPVCSVDLTGCEHVLTFANETDKPIIANGPGSVALKGGLFVEGAKVVGATAGGWEVDKGTAKRTSNSTYTAPKMRENYSQEQVQEMAIALQDMSRTIKALKDDLYSGVGNHGIIGR